MNKHEQFIKDAYDGKINGSLCREWKEAIEKQYPEFKESMPIVGNWYKNEYGHIICITKSEKDYVEWYGFRNLIWNNKNYADMALWISELIPATDEEVRTALIIELDKLGFKSGSKFTALRDTTQEEASIPYKKEGARFGSDFEFNSKTNTLYVLGRGKYVVFENGVFANPIQTITKEEAEKILGKTIII